MYPVAFGFIDSETTDNWTWFMTQLHKAIGDLPVLAISSDACKGLENAVKNVFPQAEHRECFRHLMHNFIKRFGGDVFVSIGNRRTEQGSKSTAGVVQMNLIAEECLTILQVFCSFMPVLHFSLGYLSHSLTSLSSWAGSQPLWALDTHIGLLDSCSTSWLQSVFLSLGDVVLTFWAGVA